MYISDFILGIFLYRVEGLYPFIFEKEIGKYLAMVLSYEKRISEMANSASSNLNKLLL